MKAASDNLLNLKLGCHKNNKNVKKISAMLKKYPNQKEGERGEDLLEGKGQKQRPQGRRKEENA